jgi:hypothetical protein
MQYLPRYGRAFGPRNSQGHASSLPVHELPHDGHPARHAHIRLQCTLCWSITTVLTVSQGATHKLDLPLQFPAAAFVLPQAITSDQLRALAATPMTNATAVVPLVGGDPRETLRWVAGVLHVESVEVVQGAAALYGRTLAGHHVLVAVKAKPAGAGLQVDLKASDPALAPALIAELSAASRS